MVKMVKVHGLARSWLLDHERQEDRSLLLGQAGEIGYLDKGDLQMEKDGVMMEENELGEPVAAERTERPSNLQQFESVRHYRSLGYECLGTDGVGFYFKKDGEGAFTLFPNGKFLKVGYRHDPKLLKKLKKVK